VRLLLDHCVDVRLRLALGPHEVATAAERGWEHLKNGALLRQAAEAGFAALITTDANCGFSRTFGSCRCPSSC
jgi:hypothetical protein